MNKTSLLIFLIIFLALVVGWFYFFYKVDGPPLVDEETVVYPPVDYEPEEVNLYYYNPELDKDEAGNIICSDQGLVSVERLVSGGEGTKPIENAIKLLISGDLDESEREEGITTEFPLDGFELAGAEIENGYLALFFEDPEFRTSGGSCRTAILWAQIRATALQFSQVERVGFLPEELFQP